MSARDKQFNLLLSDEELEQLRQLAAAHDRSMNSFIRSLIRQAANKATLDIPTKKVKKQETAEVY